jgi:hypothetical protein
LRECQEDVLVGQLDVIPASRFLNGAVQALRPVLTRSEARCDPAGPQRLWREIYEQNQLGCVFRGRDTE